MPSKFKSINVPNVSSYCSFDGCGFGHSRGLRATATDKSFNAELITRLDDTLPNVNVIPQDIGPVLLNLLNNAFYAVYQKQKTTGPDCKPMMEVSTAVKGDVAEIRVKDKHGGRWFGISHFIAWLNYINK
jgi:hypothetical protein